MADPSDAALEEVGELMHQIAATHVRDCGWPREDAVVRSAAGCGDRPRGG